MKTLEDLAREAVDACGGPDDTLPHVAQILALVRAQALDEAAALIDSTWQKTPAEYAAAIRALAASASQA